MIKVNSEMVYKDGECLHLLRDCEIYVDNALQKHVHEVLQSELTFILIELHKIDPEAITDALADYVSIMEGGN